MIAVENCQPQTRRVLHKALRSSLSLEIVLKSPLKIDIQDLKMIWIP